MIKKTTTPIPMDWCSIMQKNLFFKIKLDYHKRKGHQGGNQYD